MPAWSGSRAARSAAVSAPVASVRSALRWTACRTASGSSSERISYTALATSASTMRTDAPLYGLITTSPEPASVLSASRTGVLETTRLAASSASTRAWPGRSSPLRIADLMESRTKSVRDAGGASRSYIIYQTLGASTRLVNGVGLEESDGFGRVVGDEDPALDVAAARQLLHQRR